MKSNRAEVLPVLGPEDAIGHKYATYLDQVEDASHLNCPNARLSSSVKGRAASVSGAVVSVTTQKRASPDDARISATLLSLEGDQKALADCRNHLDAVLADLAPALDALPSLARLVVQ